MGVDHRRGGDAPAVEQAAGADRARSARWPRSWSCKADVCDRFALDEAFEQATAEFGPIEGIFNLAALMDDGLLHEKLPADAEAVLGPKVVGTKNLYALAEQFGVASLVLFSSTSAIIGAAGQIDYAAANAFQDALRVAPPTEFGPRVVSINWGVWNNLGLSARAIGDILIRAAGAVPLDPDMYSPFFDAANGREHGIEMSCSTLPGDHWLFSEHRTMTNVPTMPGTGYLDLAISSRRGLGFNGGVELRDVSFLQPLQARSPDAVSRLTFDFMQADDGFDFGVYTDRLARTTGASSMSRVRCWRSWRANGHHRSGGDSRPLHRRLIAPVAARRTSPPKPA